MPIATSVATAAGSAAPYTPIQASFIWTGTAWLALSALWSIPLRPLTPPASELIRMSPAPAKPAAIARQRRAANKTSR